MIVADWLDELLKVLLNTALLVRQGMVIGMRPAQE